MKAWPRVWCGGPAQPIGEPALVVTFDCDTRNEVNVRERWGRIHRTERARAAVQEALTPHAVAAQLAALVATGGPWCVRLTRLSSSARPLDEDATGPALKAVQDAVAYALGVVDDGSPVVAFARAQERRKGPLGVRVEVWGPDAAPLADAGRELR